MSRHDISSGHFSGLRGGQVFSRTARMPRQILRPMAVLCAVTAMGTVFCLITQRADPMDPHNWIAVSMARVNTALGSTRECALVRPDRTRVRMPAERIGSGPQNPLELRARLAGKRVWPEGGI
ncbi:hypothetical protein [Glycocaulis sp.]|uniref:hypothetical protein n=1 Tax=Glycocaulis sp. TaxID=1969725 RepID=UPI003F6F4EA4